MNCNWSLIWLYFCFSFSSSSSHLLIQCQHFHRREKGVGAQLWLTLCDLLDWSPPGSCVHGILQPWILEWVANFLLQGIFPTQWSPVSPALAGRFFTTGPPGKPFYRRVHSICFMSGLAQQLSPSHLHFSPATSSSQGYCLVGVGGAAGIADIHTSDLASQFAWLRRKIPLSFWIVYASSWSAAYKETVSLTLRMYLELSLNFFFCCTGWISCILSSVFLAIYLWSTISIKIWKTDLLKPISISPNIISHH